MSNALSVPNSTETGKKGELIAGKFLKEIGFEIIVYNYRYKRTEIDIIGISNNLLVFVEVKYRANIMYGQPETFVSKAKEKRMKTGAENYILENNWINDIRFDIISIVDNNGKLLVEHFIDCF